MEDCAASTNTTVLQLGLTIVGVYNVFKGFWNDFLEVQPYDRVFGCIKRRTLLRDTAKT